MDELLASSVVTVSINRDPGTVYEFASYPQNLPAWAAGLGSTMEHRDGKWVVQTPRGPTSIRFETANSLGVLDHWVTLPDGQEVYVPMRVYANRAGSEIAFTIFRVSGTSADDHARDVEMVTRDLETLKRLLEAET